MVNIALVEKGWMPVATGGDISIAAVETTRERSSAETYYGGFENWRWDWTGSGHGYVVRMETVGT